MNTCAPPASLRLARAARNRGLKTDLDAWVERPLRGAAPLDEVKDRLRSVGRHRDGGRPAAPDRGSRRRGWNHLLDDDRLDQDSEAGAIAERHAPGMAWQLHEDPLPGVQRDDEADRRPKEGAIGDLAGPGRVRHDCDGLWAQQRIDGRAALLTVDVEGLETLAEDLHIAVIAEAPGQPVHRPDELGDERRRRLPVDGFRRVELFEPAVLHDADAVGDRERLGLVVRDEQGRDAEPLLEAADFGSKLRSDAGIERRQGFVEQEHRGLDRERAGDGDSLLLATGELVRIAIRRFAKSHELQQLVGLLETLRLVVPAHAQPEGDVGAHVHVREQAVGLKDHAHVALVRRHAR